MKRGLTPLSLSLMVAGLPAISATFLSAADEPAAAPSFAPEQIEFFETKIRPVLADHCYQCHDAKHSKNGLQLDARDGWLKGSDYRKVVNLEKPAESAVLLALRHQGGKINVENMPKDGDKLSDSVVADVEKWIAMGLPWPDEPENLVRERTKGGNHWAFQPVVKPEIPADFSGNPIDFFIDRKLAEAGLKPAPRADRATLYRRANFDLVGLPPEFADVQKFVADPKPDAEAWPALVEHLMDSPHYGERQARLWMDIARYSDTRGYEAGGRERRFIYSYTYRDWLIRSFNADLPYDKFVLYQLAAEQLVDREDPEARQNLAALGFLTLSKNGNQEEVFADRIDTTFRGLQALTVGCARCHDHKFDPVPTSEYYGFYGVFLNSVEPESPPTIGMPKSGPEYDEYQKKLGEKQKVVDDFLQPKLAEIGKQNPEIANRPEQLMRKLERPDRKELEKLQKAVDKFIADSKMEPDKALILEDRDKPIEQRVFIRGSASRRGEVAPRKFLSVVAGKDASEFQTGSGRLEMAQAIASPDNQLTARVIVNRIWMQHFGEGLVRTVSDFGIQGEKPTHPELLDFLAAWFVENGWSIKKLHQLILTSQAWQRASAHPDYGKPGANFATVDPENRLLWRQNRQRLDFEQMHDSLLDVAANLDDKVFGRSVPLLEPPFSNRRAVYAFIDRQNVDPTFRNFDFSNPQEHTGKRPRTSIPMQALFMLNSEFIQQQAKLVMTRPEIRNAADPDAKIDALYRAVLSRAPSERDRVMGRNFVQEIDQSLASFGTRQTLTDWQYGFGGVDPETEAVAFQRLEF
ncbi:MAG: PSD1 domain-containing protein, partial [Verrucomicrobiae bacterium]|nr:PSD1 domain-containing protein [Verrucomicrobiae bacterium]